MKLRLLNGKDLIKEEEIDLYDDKVLLINKESNVCNEDNIEIIFKTNSCPEEHIKFFDLVSSKIHDVINLNAEITLQVTMLLSRIEMELIFSLKEKIK